MKAQTSSKTGQIKSSVLELHPLDCWKSDWLRHQHISFSFEQSFEKHANKVGMDRILNKFKNWPEPIINLRVMSPWLLKKPLFDFVISILASFNWMVLRLADKDDMIKFSDSSKPGQIRSLILELLPLDCWKSLFVISIMFWSELPETCSKCGQGWNLGQVRKVARSDH